MKNIYYVIWVDSILRFKKNNPKDKDWKFKILLMNSLLNAFTFWMITIWLKFFKIYNIPLINFTLFPGNLLNNFCSFLIEFALPFGLLNYFLIFNNDRYKKILEKYAVPKGKYALIHSYIVLLSSFISAVIYYIFD